MATLIHATLDEPRARRSAAAARLAIATQTLPAARVGRPYARAAHRDGRHAADPLDAAAGALPAGVRLTRDGRLTGTPTAAGRRDGDAARDRCRGAAASGGSPIVVRRRDGARVTPAAASIPAMPLAISFLFFLPFIILGVVLLLMLVLFLLARIQNGRFLRPIVTQLSKIPFMRRWFQKMSVAAYERSNPELAGAIKKMQSFGEIKTPEQAQRALAVMTPAERKAYMEMVGEQGAMPEPVNRDQRRRVERGAQGMIVQQRPGASRPQGQEALRRTAKPLPVGGCEPLPAAALRGTGRRSGRG